MNDYREGFRHARRETLWTLPRLVAVLGIVAIVIVVGGVLVGVITAPLGVVSKTVRPDNIINNYEWFHDAHGAYTARTRQVAERKTWLEAEKDEAERRRLRIELGAISQSCRDLAAQYNANAVKSNRALFMGKTLPLELNQELCS